MTIVLHQFAFSHFNEKARWALDYKGVEHRRESYLPGPHMPAIKKLSGQTQTPVMQLEDECVAGSAQIIDRLEKDFPEKPLYPAEPAQRQEALDLQRRLDEEFGPAVRTMAFVPMLENIGYIAAMFGRDASAAKRFFYRLSLPMVKPMIAKGNGVNPENIARSRDIVARYLDEHAERILRSEYCVGDAFSVADLCHAALLAPITRLTYPDMKRPDPVPEGLAELVQTYEDHPAIGWVRKMYERHRP